MIDAGLATAGKPCDLGNDPSKYLEHFEDWYDHTSLLADSIGIKDNAQKLKLILLWVGRQFHRFAKEAGVTTEGTAQTTSKPPSPRSESMEVNMSTSQWRCSNWCRTSRDKISYRVRQRSRRPCRQMPIRHQAIWQKQGHEGRFHIRHIRW